MLRNNRLSLSAHDASLGIFQQLLTYKAESAGSHVVTLVDPAYTSQACSGSGCGALIEKDLSVRVHVCPDCFLELDRDINAARNILSLALNSARIEPSGVKVGGCAVPGLRSPRLRRVIITEPIDKS
jgi:putative transposase